ncbi:hypothetical protein [Streptomyces sp. HD]|uniref:hypothetical protein n=1 Tax=Streptomyces sp. HD TaxID=3020892 RepID=UPI002330DA6F|nr:hypothetical protein [Streptomyces sp. HD]MDC0771362.1 hypothetical protein [Streptomyces sp. HD]
MGLAADRPKARQTAQGTTPNAEGAETATYATSAGLFGPRGRHRRPRPRKVLLAAGGLALAAGALSLVRLTPDPVVTDLGATESGDTPPLDLGTDSVPTPHPKPSPSTTSAMGGPGATPTTGTIVVRTTNTPVIRQREVLATPDAPRPTPHPPATSEAPRPTATPPPTPDEPSTSPPSPQPTQPDENTVCIPVIALCVDPLND